MTCPVAETTFDHRGFIANLRVSDDVALHLSCHNVQIFDSGEWSFDAMSEVTKDDAIEMAKSILRQYRVPFCNRVRNDTG